MKTVGLAVTDFVQTPMSPVLAATLARASEAAEQSRASEVTLEHLLAALCDDNDALSVLDASRVRSDRLLADIADYLARSGITGGSQGGPLGVSPALKRILEAAAAAAQGGRRRDINGAIVLAAIVGDGKSAAAQMLQAQGLTFDEAIRALQAALTAPAKEPAPLPAEDVLARARERVQSRATPSLRDLMSDMPRTVPPPPLPPGSMPPPAESAPPQPVTASPQPAPVEPKPSFIPSVPAPVQPEPAHSPSEQAKPGWSEATLPQWEEAKLETETATPASAPPTMPPMSAPTSVPESGQAAARVEPAAAAPALPSTPAVPPPPAALTPHLPAPSIGDPHPGSAGSGGYVYPTQPHSYPQPPPQPSFPPTPSSGFEFPRPVAVTPPPIPPPIPRPGMGPGMGTGGMAPQMPPPMGAPIARGPQFPGQGPAPFGVPPSGHHLPTAAPASSGLGAPGAQMSGVTPPAAAPRKQAEAAAKRGERGKSMAGQLAENIPRSMRVGRSERVEIRIAKAEAKAISEGLEGGGAAWTHEVTITKAMSVRLRAPEGGFFIETASPETQWIEGNLGFASDDFASWRFLITPRLRGRSRLQIIVSARTVGADGVAAETALPDQVVEVKVRTNYGRAFMRTLGWAAAAVAGGVLAKFGDGAFDMIKATAEKFVN